MYSSGTASCSLLTLPNAFVLSVSSPLKTSWPLLEHHPTLPIFLYVRTFHLSNPRAVVPWLTADESNQQSCHFIPHAHRGKTTTSNRVAQAETIHTYSRTINVQEMSRMDFHFEGRQRMGDDKLRALVSPALPAISSSTLSFSKDTPFHLLFSLHIHMKIV